MSRVSVLVVDDDGSTRWAMQDVLDDEGYAVRLAANGRHALEQIETQVPAILLTDYEMPELDGERLIERVREHHPHMPILVLTSRAVDDARREAERLGVMDYLYKPVDFDVLLGRISAALDAGWSSSPTVDRSAAAR